MGSGLGDSADGAACGLRLLQANNLGQLLLLDVKPSDRQRELQRLNLVRTNFLGFVHEF